MKIKGCVSWLAFLSKWILYLTLSQKFAGASIRLDVSNTRPSVYSRVTFTCTINETGRYEVVKFFQENPYRLRAMWFKGKSFFSGIPIEVKDNWKKYIIRIVVSTNDGGQWYCAYHEVSGGVFVNITAVVAPHLCVDDMRANLAQCIAPYDIDPELFLVNVTHDRTAILKDKNTAARFCQERLKVYKCMNTTIDSCLGAKEILEECDHQKNQLQNAINMTCNDLNTYETTLQCASSTKSALDSCTPKLNRRNLNQDFCLDSYDQLLCKIDAIQSSCPKAAIGFKIEFECSSVPYRCLASQGSSFKNVCSEKNYNRNDRSLLPLPSNKDGGSRSDDKRKITLNIGTSYGQIDAASRTILFGLAIFFLL